MIIKSYYKTKYNKNFSYFAGYKESAHDGFSINSDIHAFLNDYEYVFDKIGRLKVSELHDPETLYEISTETMTCGLDPKTKIIYITFHEDVITYDDKNWPLDEDLSGTQLAIQGKIPSTKLSEENFIELLYNWQKINLLEPPFALIWQDEQDWIHAKAFGSEKDMDAFIKKHY